MSNINDFVIENGVLKKYAGSDSEAVIPEGVETIGSFAFVGVASIVNVIVPSSVTKIENSAFWRCKSIKSIKIKGLVKEIGENAFRECVSLVSVDLPDSVEKIGWDAFKDCAALKEFKIPSAITSIGCGIFSGCSSLTEIIIPEGVKVVDKHAFHDCAALKSIIVPSSVTSIQLGAFQGCVSLEQVTIKSSKIEISQNVFSQCYALRAIDIESSYKYVSYDGVLYKKISKDELELLCYPPSKRDKTLYLPKGIKSISGWTFSKCNFLEEVVIPNTVINVEKYAFSSCINLKTLRFETCAVTCEKDFISGSSDTKVKLPTECFYEKTSISPNIIPYLSVEDSKAVAGIWLYQSGKAWDVWFEKQSFDACDVLKAIAALLSTQKKITPKQIARIQEFGEKYSSVISADSIGEVVDGLLSGNTKTAETVKNAGVVKVEKINIKNSIPLEQKYATASSFSTELDCITKGVRYKDYDIECSLPVIKTLLEEYLALWNENKRAYHGAMSSGYNLGPIRQLKKPEEAEKIAAELDPEALSDYLEKLAFGKDYRFFAIPYARFATENSMQKCVKEIASKMKGNAKNQYWAGTLKEALQYSDTRAAAEYLEKYPMDFAKYTRLRGITVQEYRDIYSVPNFGFDKDGTKKYVVDGIEIKAQIANTCSLYLTESASGKLVKSISKKTPEGAKASEEYTSLKKNVEEFYSKRKEYIKKIYITAEAITEKSWCTIYTVNPLFRPIIESLIWVDSKDVYFEVVSGKCKNVNGDEYTPIGNIKIAHVMNMTTTQVSEWQRHLIANQKSLIIEQVWEPVINLDNISRLSSRYNGVVMSKQERNSFKKALKEKAIDVRSEAQKGEYDHRAGKYVYDSNGTMLIGSRLRLDYEVDESTGDITLGILRNLDNLVSKRELNTIIFELDRATLKSVILKDDISALSDNLLSTFTVAQISEFVDCAIKNNCTNCTAYLLNYKNEKFGEDSVFDMFVLD